MDTAHGEDIGAARDAATIARLERLAANTTRRVHFLPRGHVLFDYDDALSVARLAAWKAHRDYRADAGCRWETWIILKVRHALLEAFRSVDYGAAVTRGGVRTPEFLALEAFLRPRVYVDSDQPTQVEELFADPRDEPSEIAARLDCANVLRVLRWLPAREAEVLRAYYLEDVTHRVIARRLELSESRVHQLHRQALDRARLMLEDE